MVCEQWALKTVTDANECGCQRFAHRISTISTTEKAPDTEMMFSAKHAVIRFAICIRVAGGDDIELKRGQVASVLGLRASHVNG